MAEIVNLQVSEYDFIVNELKKNHNETLDLIKNSIQDIEKLITLDGTFSTNEVSKKVQSLLDAINNDLISNMKVIFETSEKSVDEFLSIIMTCDTFC